MGQLSTSSPHLGRFCCNLHGPEGPVLTSEVAEVCQFDNFAVRGGPVPAAHALAAVGHEPRQVDRVTW